MDKYYHQKKVVHPELSHLCFDEKSPFRSRSSWNLKPSDTFPAEFHLSVKAPSKIMPWTKTLFVIMRLYRSIFLCKIWHPIWDVDEHREHFKKWTPFLDKTFERTLKDSESSKLHKIWFFSLALCTQGLIENIWKKVMEVKILAIIYCLRFPLLLNEICSVVLHSNQKVH